MHFYEENFTGIDYVGVQVEYAQEIQRYTMQSSDDNRNINEDNNIAHVINIDANGKIIQNKFLKITYKTMVLTVAGVGFS